MAYTETNPADYSVPRSTRELLQHGIFENPLIAANLPKEIKEAAQKIHFVGSDMPSLPINWRFAESISALKGLEAATINVLLKRKYGLEYQKAVINTDQAQLFILSPVVNTIDPDGDSITFASIGTPKGKATFESYFKNTDVHNLHASGLYGASATNIYRCKDGRYFHLHGSMNNEPTQRSLGLPLYQNELTTPEASYEPYIEKVAQIGSEDLQKLASDTYKQAGTICWTTEEFRNSEHGKANAHVGLFEINGVKNERQSPSWWPDSPETSPRRPLAGLKVVDLTRVIAGPSVTRGLAELGASVMRITAEHVTDMNSLHPDLNWGKWNAHLDLRMEEDRERLRALVRAADVIVDGYRPGVMEKYGFSADDLLEITKNRERGLIVARENCYGWHGPWAYRSGWQQISDANVGVSMEFGRAMGNDEPVTPVFPNSDFCTGVSGVVGILSALLRRGAEGGSYKVDIALNYYSQWLVNSVGTYSPAIWSDLWSRNGKAVFRHYHNMPYTLPRVTKMIKDNSSEVFNPAFFEKRYSGAIGTSILCPKPIINFTDGLVQLGYNVGTRGNGVDQARWPEDLMTEVIVS